MVWNECDTPRRSTFDFMTREGETFEASHGYLVIDPAVLMMGKKLRLWTADSYMKCE